MNDRIDDLISSIEMLKLYLADVTSKMNMMKTDGCEEINRISGLVDEYMDLAENLYFIIDRITCELKTMMMQNEEGRKSK